MKKILAIFMALVMIFSCITVCFAKTSEIEEKTHGETFDYGNLTWIVEMPFWPADSNTIGNAMYSIFDFFISVFTFFGLADDKTADAARDVMQNGMVEHSLTWTVVKDATCVDEGVKTATCKICDYTAEKIIPVKSHALTTINTPATCTQDGIEKISCANCDFSDENVSPAIGHDYKTSVVAPTHENSGYTLHECKNCSDSYKTDETFLETVQGTIISLRYVSPDSHELAVSISSDTITDFSDVYVKKYGKNLLNLSDFSAYGSGISNINADGDTLTYNKQAGDMVGGVATVVYLPKGTYSLNYIAGGSTLGPCTLISSQDGSVELYRGYDTPNGGTTFEVTVAGNYRILIYGSYSSKTQQTNTISNLQLEVGAVTAYTPFNAYQTVKANEDGTVTGLTSVSPDITLVAESDVVILCEYIKSDILSNPDYMKPSDIKVIADTQAKKNKTITFSAEVKTFDKLIIAHSDGGFSSTYIEISNTSIDVYYCYSSFEKIKSIDHNLLIKDDISVILSVNELGVLSVSITSSGNTFTKENLSVFGGKGSIKAESINTLLKNVDFTWNSTDFNKDIWVMGDSYVSIDSSRWPYYLLQEKDNFALFGYPGAASPALYNDFVNSLQYGKPTYAIWCMGMNEADKNDTLNAQWKLYVEKFVALCEENGITPILATIPNVPERNNSYKNEYVRNSGYRYIDFATAVGANDVASTWFEGMLHSDNVHPTALGAQALAEQILKDVPELE